jgi:transposase, IS30 family
MPHLTAVERQQIFLHKKQGYSLRDIAKMLDRHVSAISRELRRNSMSDGSYYPKQANHKAYVRWKQRKVPHKKIRQDHELERFIREKLQLYWSPETIAGVWNKEHTERGVNVLTVYRYVYSRFGCGLWQYLESQREKPRKRRPQAKRALIPNRSWIETRPELADTRTRLGDYEGDLIVSVKDDRAVILTTICKTSRLLMARLLPNKKPWAVMRALQKLLRDKPQETLTLDNGIEFREHQQLGFPTYFCHPYSSWEKGQVEYANRLIRRDFPKKTRLSGITPRQLARVIFKINNLPRKCLNWDTPAQVFARLLKNSPQGVAFTM